MHKSVLSALLWPCLALFAMQLMAQPTDTVKFTLLSDFKYPDSLSAYKPLFDRLDRDILYSANNNTGLIIYEIGQEYELSPIDTFTISQFDGRFVSNLLQDSIYLYATLGGVPGGNQPAGLAIFDVSDPWNTQLLSSWDSTAIDHSAAIVLVENDTAFLGVMDNGIVILDVSDKADIRFISTFRPDPDWPQPPGLFTQPHARGLARKGRYLYVCNDAGGLRVLDISDPMNILEIEKYINADLDASAAVAYNNIVIKDNYAIASVDYCGIELLDISDPYDLQPVEWVNLWGCGLFNWSGSPGHTNQLEFSADGNLLFVSAGDSEALVFDVSGLPDITLAGSYAFPGDSAATWGLDVYGQQVALAFVDNHFIWIPGFQPFYSDFGGLQILEWSKVTNLDNFMDEYEFSMFPNPTHANVTLTIADPTTPVSGNYSVAVLDLDGHQAARFTLNHHQTNINLSSLTEGLYFLAIYRNGKHLGSMKIVKF